MKSLHIEWQHIEKNGKTCRRCAETGKTLRHVINELTEELRPKAVSITLTETTLSTDEVSQSNRIFVNGVALEDLLSDVTVSENPCSSCAEVCGCGDLCGKDVNCRTVVSEGVVYEVIPAPLIRRAALQILEQQPK